MDKPVTSSKTLARALLSPVFPVLIAVVFLALATALRVGLKDQDNHQLQANLANEAEAMTTLLEREFQIHAEAIDRMASRMTIDPTMTEYRWRADARNYLQNFGVYQAVEWIDQNFVIRWLEPLAGNENVIGYNVAFSEQRRQALETARETGAYDISDVINLRQGGKGMVIYAPVGLGAANRGFVAGVFRMQTLVEQLLDKRVLNNFLIEIHNAGHLRYTLNQSADIDPGFSASAPVNLPSLDWTLTLKPPGHGSISSRVPGRG